MFVEPGIYQYKDILLNGIAIPHDRVDGRRFGMATVWSWEQNNLKIVHMVGWETLILIVKLFLSAQIYYLFQLGGIKSYNGSAKNCYDLKPNVVIPVYFEVAKKLIKNVISQMLIYLLKI